MNSILLSPMTINTMTLKNRVMLAAMVTNTGWRGEVTDRLIAYHEERVKGGCGLNTLEATLVELAPGAPTRRLALNDDRFIPGLKRLIDAVHALGGRLSVQLVNHGRMVNPENTGCIRHLVSYIPGRTSAEDSRVLTIDEIKMLVRLYVEAAQRAVKAGADCLELHGAHGYIIQQFMSPYTNQRTDSYGGSFENRMRFPTEVLHAIRVAVGKNYPIIFRLVMTEMVPGGIEVDEAKKMAQYLVEQGVDALSLTASTVETQEYLTPPAAVEAAWLRERSKQVYAYIKGRVPIILVGRILNCSMGEELIREGAADAIAYGRALLADPELVNKYAEGQEEDVIPCVGCNEGCISRFRVPLPISCTVNPRVCNELHYPDIKVAKSRKVVVVGAGPAGMQAALTADKRGHSVTLVDKSSEVGGLLPLAAIPPFKTPLTWLLQSYKRRLAASSVAIQLGKEVDADDIAAMQPDAVLVAVGGVPIVPPCCADAPVQLAANVLLGEPVGKNVLILGGGLVGSELAEFLANQDKSVTIVEMRDAIALDMEACTRKLLMARLTALRTRQILKTELAKITEDKSILLRDEYKEEFWLHGFDSIILALGYLPNTRLLSTLKQKGIAAKAVGDCAGMGGNILAAIAQGFKEAYEL